MKKYIIILLVSFIPFTGMCQDESVSVKEYGLISYLTTIKTLAENKVYWSELKYSKFEKDKSNKKNEDLLKEQTATKEKVLSSYALLKWKTEVLINQLAADMVNKNSLKLYRNLDRQLKSYSQNSGLNSKYISMITEIDEAYNELMRIEYPTSLNFITPITEILTLVGVNPYDLIKNSRAVREKKVEKIIGYLKELRLKSTSELVKPKENSAKKSTKEDNS